MQSHFRTVGWLLVTAAALMLGSWTGLMVTFDYPQILRQDPGSVLSRFLAGGGTLRLFWAGMTLSAVLLIPAIVGLHRAVTGPRSAFLLVGTVFGVLSGLVQVLGLIRWVLVVPTLAQAWQDDPAQRPVWEALFTVVNQYGGVAVGETLGYLFTGIWMVFQGLALVRSRIAPAAGWVAVAVGLGIGAGLLENLGWEGAVAVNAAAFLGLLGLFLYWGIRLILGRFVPASSPSN